MTGYRRGREHVTPWQLKTLELLREMGHAAPQDIATALGRSRAATEITLACLADKGLAVEDRVEGEVGLRWRCAQRGEVRSITLASELAARTARLRPGEVDKLEVRVAWIAVLDSVLIGDAVWPVERQQRFAAPVHCDRAVRLTRDSRTPDDLRARPGDLLLLARPTLQLERPRLVLAEDCGIERLMLADRADERELPVSAWMMGLWRTIP